MVLGGFAGDIFIMVAEHFVKLCLQRFVKDWGKADVLLTSKLI